MIDNRNSETVVSGPFRTSSATTDNASVNTKPEFIRLPKSGTQCFHTGLTRSKMNQLVLPCAANGFKPPVKSISLRCRGQIKAVRLVVYDSLMAYLRSFLEEGGTLE
jgi:hypothetical protein